MRVLQSIVYAALRQLRLLFVIGMGYLLQVCVMPYFAIADVTPSILFPIIAIIAVGYGRLRALWTGAFYGILLEVMLPTVRLLNLALYPITALFSSAFFADRSETKLEYERSIGKPGRNRNPYLRTPLCCALCVIVYEVVNLVYMYLGGSPLTGDMIRRSLINVLSSTALSLLLAWPVRRILGFRRLKAENPAAMRFGYRQS